MNMTRGTAATTCSTCGSAETMTVSISMEDGSVRFWTCTECEATGWRRDGSDIARDVALARIPRR
ncbi:MAG: hypothetical protein ACRDH1_04170, partial [Actinomycetota bacterium]